MDRRLSRMILMTWMLLFGLASSQGCGTGWFGTPDCQFKCHCASNKCDDDGECLYDSKCESEWFGPKCQYVDLTPNGTETTSLGTAQAKIADGDDTTCIDEDVQSVTVGWNITHYFTWMRIVVKDTAHNFLNSLSVQFRQMPGAGLTCINQRHSIIDNKTVDILCDLNVTVQEVILSGDGVKSICSLYISGGRNVALKQSTSQSTQYQDWDESLAVDGNTTGAYNTCSSTQEVNAVQSWNVTLSRPQLVNRYRLYNRNEYRDRLRGFTITSFYGNGTKDFTYSDATSLALDVYTVVTVPTRSPVLHVQVNSREPSGSEKVIHTLCEVEIFGECPAATYGFDCAQPCSIDCEDKMCHHANGHCYRCIPGKIGDFCNQDCPHGYYGQDCKDECSINCGSDGSCDTRDGTCSYGCQPGYTGPTCSETCVSPTFGQDCKNNCSQYCVVNATLQASVCDHVSGKCLLGCVEGYEGDDCSVLADGTSSSEFSPSMGIGLGVGLGFAVALVVIVVVSVHCYRRRSRSSSAREQRSGVNNSDEPTGKKDQKRVASYAMYDYYNSPASVTRDTRTPDEQESAEYENPDLDEESSQEQDERLARANYGFEEGDSNAKYYNYLPNINNDTQ